MKPTEEDQSQGAIPGFFCPSYVAFIRRVVEDATSLLIREQPMCDEVGAWLRNQESLLVLPTGRPVITAVAAPIESSDPRPTRKVQRKKGRARPLILSAIDSFIQDGQWGLTVVEICRQADVPPATFYRLVKQDESVRRAVSSYRARSRGRGPIRWKGL